MARNNTSALHNMVRHEVLAGQTDSSQSNSGITIHRPIRGRFYDVVEACLQGLHPSFLNYMKECTVCERSLYICFQAVKCTHLEEKVKVKLWFTSCTLLPHQ